MTKPACDSALLTDLYEFTMLQSYFDCGMNGTATFELFVRKLPAHRNFLMAAGLEQALDYLADLTLDAHEIEALASTGLFSGGFLASLESLRFTGSVRAMREGTVFFADEPILQITAPMREAQLIESRVMNLLHYESIVASKAARAVLAAPGKTLVDFGLRRAHGAEAALLSARASYVAGFAGTATLLAGLRYGIPTYGTMAHSYVQAHDDESLAFEHFARSFPRNAMLLVDTYDTEAAVRKVIAVAGKLARDGVEVKGVRLDSGDLAQHAMRVRALLDRAGLVRVTIFASGNLDEYRLAELIGKGAPIDGFGVGTRMNTSADAPYADCAYKLTEYAGVPRRKRSEGKATWPGRKQVFRRYRDDGVLDGDCLALHDEAHAGVALLEPVMIDGERVAPPPSLADVRAHASAQLDALPAALRDLTRAAEYPVAVTDALSALAQRLDAQAASDASLA
ncbi:MULTISPECIES: nicotinate phosphoribosyltransferase [unclassified Burkholderia]|uniref:nicotinate phosphoribosyltransferase n=1 Tax=unclassified Burkholderia TaxID=2613784 RepID=UPI0007593279|nr:MULTISPECIES: nicotinate phosphoribosyltransferase [unclassified Burkholderia]KVN13689.1 nicotinate phosphoribosyltransferase [Burkholderia sp. MSMB1552]KWZ54927.1 nicotinate phosphoribosyltransferase [Burkholderia sp. MSMB1588]